MCWDLVNDDDDDNNNKSALGIKDEMNYSYNGSRALSHTT